MMKIAIRFLAVAFAALLLLPACNSDGTKKPFSLFPKSNNDIPISELVRHIIFKTNAQPACDMEPGPIHAESGFSVILAGRQVAFYKYDTNKKKMRAKLDYIEENGCVFIAGRKYSAVVNGSFVMVDYDTNLKKNLLLKVFYEF